MRKLSITSPLCKKIGKWRAEVKHRRDRKKLISAINRYKEKQLINCKEE